MAPIAPIERKASAIWQGGLKNGKGTIHTSSKAIEGAPYSFGTRFESAAGTNPEELIAGAHAACFSMALSAELGKKGATVNQISTDATVTLEQLTEGWRVTEVRLDVVGDVTGIASDAFVALADEARRNCPISRLLNAKITMSAKLKQKAA